MGDELEAASGAEEESCYDQWWCRQETLRGGAVRFALKEE